MSEVWASDVKLISLRNARRGIGQINIPLASKTYNLKVRLINTVDGTERILR